MDNAGDNARVLIDGLDAGIAGFHGRAEVDRLALEGHLAFIGMNGAGNRLDKRGFPGTVVADHRQHFAGIEIEIRMVEGGDAAIALHKAASGEDGFSGHQPATFLIHWSMATAKMINTPMIR